MLKLLLITILKAIAEIVDIIATTILATLTVVVVLKFLGIL